jgi:diacylglycerol kinase (ATP)
MSAGAAVEGIVTALGGTHPPTTVDAVRAAGRWYVGILAAGFDARVNARANRMRWPGGPRRYELAVLAELGVFRPIGYVLELDGERIELDGMLVAVGNIASYGGGMQMCAGADPQDGLLDVVIAHRMSRATLLRLLLAVRSGGHLRHPAVELRRTRVVSLATRDPAGLLAYADGEPLARLPLTAEVVPGALTLLAPPRSRGATPP